MNTPTFRRIPVFDDKCSGCVMKLQEIPFMTKAPSNPAQIVSKVYELYENVVQRRRDIDRIMLQQVFLMDRLPYDEDSRPVPPNCGNLLQFFFDHHNSLTSNSIWNQGDLRDLYVVFSELSFHFQSVYYRINDDINELEKRLSSNLEHPFG